MQDDQVNIDRDIEFDKKMRYVNLMVAKWRIEEELNREYPYKMHESRKNLARIMLKWRAINCKHEE